MSKITIALIYEKGAQQSALVDELLHCPVVEEVVLLNNKEQNYQTSRLKSRWLHLDSFNANIAQVLSATLTEYLLLILPGQSVRLGAHAIERFLQTAEDSGAGLVYSDFKDEANNTVTDHPLIDY